MTTMSDKSRREFNVGLREPLDSTQLLQVVNKHWHKTSSCCMINNATCVTEGFAKQLDIGST